MRSVKWAILCAGLCLPLLAGCAPSPAPVVPEAEDAPELAGPSGASALSHESVGAPPRLIDRLLYRGTPVLDRVVDGITAIHLEPWQAEVAVGSGDVMLTWQLDTHDASSYRGLLRTEGAEPVQVRTVLGVIQARFEPPLPDQWTAWLEGVAGSRTTLIRKPEPTVAISYQGADGAMIPLEGYEAILPAGPLRLQLDFDQLVDARSLAGWLAGLEQTVGQSVTVDQVESGRWFVTMEEVPARLDLDVRNVVAADSGLPVARYPLTIWNEAGLPYLERVDLATGATERLLQLPPEISEAWPSADGARIALRSWQNHGKAMWEDRAYVVDLAAHRVEPAPFQAGTLHWAADRLVNRPPWWAEEQAWQVWDLSAGEAATSLAVPLAEPVPGAVAFSPDGEMAAYLGAEGLDDPEQAEPAWAPLVLVDLQTGEARTVEGFVRNWYRGKGDARRWLAWSPDGSRIAALDSLARSGESALVVYDLTQGERQVVSDELPVLAWGTRLAWSADGDHVLAYGGGRPPWIIPAEGGPAISLEDAWHGQAFWDETGGRVLGAREPWEGVFVYTLADGSRVDLGDGLPAGWGGDAVYVIRWPGAHARYVPPAP